MSVNDLTLTLPAGYVAYFSRPVYVGVDYETVQWSQVSDPTSWGAAEDDGSAAYEPESAEFRPPALTFDGSLHWLESQSGVVVASWREGMWCLQEPNAGLHVTVELHSAEGLAALGYRYLGPAEWNPVAADVAKRLDAGAGAYHALSVANARIAALEAEVARLVAVPDDWLAMRIRADQMRDMMQKAAIDNPDQYLATFPANAMKHSV